MQPDLRYVATLTVILFMACTGLSPVSAEEAAPAASIAPDLIKVNTPTYKPDFEGFSPNRGKYEYRVSWQGIPAAEVLVDVEERDETYQIVTNVRTFSAIDIFYKLRYRAEGIVSALNLMPERMSIEHRENSRVKMTEMSFRDDGTIHSVFTHVGKESQTFDFNPNNFTLDPFSAAFLARSLSWTKGETKTFDTFNGKSRYLISLTAEDRTRTFINGENRDVWVIVPRVEKLTDPNAEKKLRDAKIYVTADKARDVLQIVSEVFVGSVTTRLVSFVPSSKPSQAAQFAQLREKNEKAAVAAVAIR